MSSLPESHYAAHKQPRRQKREHPGKARVAVKQKLSAFTDIGCLVSCYKPRGTENGGVAGAVFGDLLKFTDMEARVLLYHHICQNIAYYRANMDSLPLPITHLPKRDWLGGVAAFRWIAGQIGKTEAWSVETHLKSALHKIGERARLGLE